MSSAAVDGTAEPRLVGCAVGRGRGRAGGVGFVVAVPPGVRRGRVASIAEFVKKYVIKHGSALVPADFMAGFVWRRRLGSWRSWRRSCRISRCRRPSSARVCSTGWTTRAASRGCEGVFRRARLGLPRACPSRVPRHALRGLVRVRAIGGEHLGRAVGWTCPASCGTAGCRGRPGEPARPRGDAGNAALVDAAASWTEPRMRRLRG